jgi:putative heme iron utilization protein
MIKNYALALLASAVFLAEAAAAEPAVAAPACATAAQVAAVSAALAGKEPGPLYGVAASLKLPEAVVASALPAAEAHGVSASHFAQIWKSLESWDDAMALVTKGANIIEIRGRVGIGEPSKRSKFFNISREGGGITGHLRPDLYSSIYAVSRPGKESTLRGVTFYDQAGDAVFSVFVPSEGETPREAVVRQFEATWTLMRSLPTLCPR